MLWPLLEIPLVIRLKILLNIYEYPYKVDEHCGKRLGALFGNNVRRFVFCNIKRASKEALFCSDLVVAYF